MSGTTNFNPKGKLAVIGGRLELDNRLVFEEMRRISNGRIAVFPTASGEPEEVGCEMVEDFQHYGFEAEMVPLFWKNKETAAFDEANCEIVKRLGSVYFTGGDQTRIIDSLRQNHQETPLLSTIRGIYQQGGLIAGSSAGAAMMSDDIILDSSSVEALVYGQEADIDQPGLTLGKGLNFFPWGIVDQHFIRRGRQGRLLKALKETGRSIGFGIDENSAMFVEDGMIQVIGEYGLVILDCRKAEFTDNEYRNVLMSYLDDGDRYDLYRYRHHPHPHKKRIRVRKASFRTPAPLQRRAFGSYALHDLMIRLAHGDPHYYNTDQMVAYDRNRKTEVTVELARLPRRSRALKALVNDETRITAINFGLNVTIRKINNMRWQDIIFRQPMNPTNRDDLSVKSRLIMLSNSPIDWSRENAETICQSIEEPVGIIAAASGDSRAEARDLVDWLYLQGFQATDLNIDIRTIEHCNTNKELLERIARKRTLIFTGGDQHRLVETLRSRGESTPVLKAIGHAYKQGASLVAIGAAASSMSDLMITDGNSVDAFRYGASADAGNRGIVIEEGLEFFPLGIVDQRLLSRRRLGRLIVACAEQSVRFGFGLCEESGLVYRGGDDNIAYAFGRHGFVVVRVEPDQFELTDDLFNAKGVQVIAVRPGEAFDLTKEKLVNSLGRDDVDFNVERMLDELARECGTRLAEQPADKHPRDWLKLMMHDSAEAEHDVYNLDIISHRA